jgi:hypothetical protein
MILIADEAEDRSKWLEEVSKVDKSEKTYRQWELKGKDEDGATIWRKGLYIILSKGGRCKLFREPLNEFI